MLVIKTNKQEAPAGADKLFRDALVTEGTLLCLDFSNRGTLDGYSIVPGAKVKDLARESAGAVGIVNDIECLTVTGQTLTTGKGLNLGDLDPDPISGLRFSNSLLDYLFINQPHALLTFWVRPNQTATAGQLFRSYTGSTYNQPNIRVNVANATGKATPTFGGVQGAPIELASGQVKQISIERKVDNTGAVYSNGYLFSSDTTNPTGGGFVDGDNWGIGRMEGSVAGLFDGMIYRILIEDLGVSGRAAADVVLKDWNYVRASGEYEGIEARPFIEVA